MTKVNIKKQKNNSNKNKLVFNIEEAEAGFDLTEISAMAWYNLLVKEKMIYTNRKKDKDFLTGEVNEYKGAFVYGFKEGHIVTNNEPLFGTYSNPIARQIEMGYASYIGITGTKAFVRRVCRYINKHASYVKEFNPKRRQFI